MSLYHQLVEHFSTDEQRIKHLIKTYAIRVDDAKKLIHRMKEIQSFVDSGVLPERDAQTLFQKLYNIHRFGGWGDHRVNSMIKKYLRKKCNRRFKNSEDHYN